MTNCPCCSYQMLRHVRHHEVYWLCRHCWQEMPELELRSLSFASVSCVRPFKPLGVQRSLVKV